MCLTEIQEKTLPPGVKLLFSKVPEPKPYKKKYDYRPHYKRYSEPKILFKKQFEHKIYKKQPEIILPIKKFKFEVKWFQWGKFFLRNFLIISNLIWGLFNISNHVFLKTVNIRSVTYWTLFNYSKEKYYCLKNTQLPHPSFSFFKLSLPDTSLESNVGNLISLKKANVGFDLPYKKYKDFLTSFLDTNIIISEEDRGNRLNFLIDFKEDEEDFETNVWVDNSFKYKTKMLITNQRLQLTRFFNFKLKRQYRITPWISNLLKWKIKSTVGFFDLMLLNVLLSSKLVLNTYQAEWFIKHGLVYVNGKRQTKTTLFLKKFDLIQLVYSSKYVNFYFNHFNFLFKARQKFVNKFSKKLIDHDDWDLGFYLNKKTKIPKLFSRISIFNQPIPYYLEVDFLTFSASIIYQPFGFNFILNSNFHFYNYYLARLYNWKFRT